MANLSIQLMGPFRVDLNGEPITTFESDKVRALLAYLAVEADRPHRREGLVGLLWPDWPERSARGNLSQALYNLRFAIGDRSAAPPFLLVSAQTLQFNRESDFSLDLAELVALRDDAPIEQVEEAVAACQGPFLADFSLPDSAAFEGWATTTREALQRTALEALARLATHYQAAGDLERAVAHARRAVAMDPCSETSQQQLIHLLALSGDRAAALAQYRRCREILWRELGVDPAAETQALFQRIQAEELAPPPSRPAVVEVQLPDWLAGQREPFPRPVFVGREPQLARLERFLEAAVEGRGQVAFITGGPGRGKTALMEAFAERALRTYPDLLAAAGHCNAFVGVGDPYLPFRHLLSTLTGDVQAPLASGALSRDGATRLWKAMPRAVQAMVDHGRHLIDVVVPGRALSDRVRAAVPGSGLAQCVDELAGRERPLPGDLAQSQLFEQAVQVLRSLAAERPLLLILDDLQWADGASIGLLFHLGRELRGARSLIVGAYRPEEVALGRAGDRHPLEKVLSELKRQYGEVWLDLAEAEELEGRSFVDALLDSEPNRLGEDFRRTLFRHTAGHPLYTLELLRAMQERGDLVPDEQGRWVEESTLDWQTLPARVEGVIEERIGRLEPELREILTVASVEGEEFSAQVVARVAKMQEQQLLRQLSRELERRHRLVREQGEVQVGGGLLSRYRFAHALFQRYLYNELGSAERRMLHQKMGSVLEALYGEEADVIASRLARHFDEAGVANKAIPYLLSMGDRARLAYAHEEAVGAYRRAVTLLKAQNDWEGAARTLMTLGLALGNAFDFQAARWAYDEGCALWQRAARTTVAPSAPAPHPYRYHRHAAFAPLSLDPVHGSLSYVAYPRLFSGLVRLTAEARIEPEVARRWEVLDGGRRYLFHLRDDWRWSDGVPVTAGDFEYSWKRVLNPASGAAFPDLLYDVEGARAFHQGQDADPSRVGVRALDDVTLLVQLEGSTGCFLRLLNGLTCCPVPRHVVEAHGDRWTLMENLVTNGPFCLTRWRPLESMHFSRDPAYAGRFRGNLQEVQVSFSPAEEWAASLAAYEAGDLDDLEFSQFPPEERERVRQRHAREYVSLPSPGTAYISFDTARPPFDEARVRRAFALAADRERVVDVLDGGYQVPATGGFVPPGIPGHAAGIGLPFDPEGARRLLAQAGYPDGRGFPPVVARPIVKELFLCEHFLACWRENLGVQIDLQTVDRGRFHESVTTDPPHLVFNGWIADYLDADNFLRVAVDIARRAFPWSHPAYDGLVEKARRLMGPEERMKLHRQADTILIEEAYLIPTFYGRRHFLTKPWAKSPVSPLGWWSLLDVIIEPH